MLTVGGFGGVGVFTHTPLTHEVPVAQLFLHVLKDGTSQRPFTQTLSPVHAGVQTSGTHTPFEQ